MGRERPHRPEVRGVAGKANPPSSLVPTSCLSGAGQPGCACLQGAFGQLTKRGQRLSPHMSHL